MLNKIKEIKKDELLRGSAILFVMIMLYNFFNYVFQISMAKLLGPADYGILAVLMSIIYVFTIPSEAIQNIMTKHISLLSLKKDEGKIKYFVIKSLKKGLIFSLILFLIFVSISSLISDFLAINNHLIILTGAFIFFAFLVPILRGVLQGKKSFTALGTNMLIESFFKVTVSILLVYIGFRVYGPIIGILISLLVPLFIILFVNLPLTKVKMKKNDKYIPKKIYLTSLPIMISALAIVLMYSIDIIFARRFFSEDLAGQYAFVSLIGKIIIFVSSAIGKAMFPISIGNFHTGRDNKPLLKKSLSLVALLSFASLILYALIPEFLVKILSLGSNEYIAASHLLFNLGLAYSFISLSYIIILYKLSQNKLNKSAWALSIFLIIQIILLNVFNKDLYSYTLAMLFSSLLIFLYSIFLIEK